MAVYKLEKSELVLVAETLESMLSPVLAEWEDWDQFMQTLGFTLYDEVNGAYRFYRRSESSLESPAAELPGVAYMFDVNIDESNIDYILLSNRLPEYLTVLKLLEPLVNRSAAVEAQLEKDLRKELKKSLR